MDGEEASVEEEGARVRVLESDECRAVNGGCWEIQVESEGNVGGWWVS